MDLTAAIANTSMSLSSFKVQQAVQVSMLKKTMDSQEASMASLLQNMMPPAEASAPQSGHIIDVLA